MKTFFFFLENTFILGEKTKTSLPRIIFTTAHTVFHSAHTKQALRGNVGHEILIEKLEKYGLPLQLFKSCLSNRKQYTVYNNQSFNQSINQGFIFSSITQQIFILKCTHVVEKKGISDKTIYDETCANSRLQE